MLFRWLIIFCFSYFPNGTWAAVGPESFFKKPSMLSATLSPSGKNIAAIINNAEGQKLVKIDVKSGLKTALLNLPDFTEDEAVLRAVAWIDDEHIATQFTAIKKGVKDLLDTRNVQYMLVVRLLPDNQKPAEILSVRTKGWLVDALPDKKSVFLYAKSGPYSKVYQLDVRKLSRHKQKLDKLSRIDGGQFIRTNVLASISGFAIRWFINEDGKPRAVLNYDDEKKMVLNVFDQKGAPSRLKRWALNDSDTWPEQGEEELDGRIFPVALADEENTFYSLDFAEDEERSVYKINYKTGKKELVFESDSFKILGLIVSPLNKQLIGAEVLRDGDVHNVYLNEPDNSKQSRLSKGTGYLKSLIGQSQLVSLLYAEGHSQPGHYLLRDDRSGKEKLVGSTWPDLLNQLDSRLVEGSVNVDDLDIPFLLTLPGKKSAIEYPLIVLPHGGPIGVFDHRYFDPVTQFLAANGYAVLRVNFRGSSGYTAALKQAGKREWGGLMLVDIYEAASHVISRKDIAEDRVCIVGISYGGYAATMLAIKHPELFRCAVNIAGVSDLGLYLNSPYLSDQQDKWLKEQVGDSEKDYEVLKAISPVYLVEQLQRPILIMHGEKDRVVDIEHAYRLKLMLQKYQKPYLWRTFPNVGHHFEQVEDKVALFSAVRDYVAEYLNH